MSDSSVRLALLGASPRVLDFYKPIFDAWPGVEVVGAWSRTKASADRLGAAFDVPAFDDMDALVSQTKPDAALICVHSSANGPVTIAAAERGMHLLLETPLSFDIAECDAIVRTARNSNLVIEVAEQFHRRPIEQLKLKAIEEGVFGRVQAGFNDFHGHGYHGISVMRSYLGFDQRATRVMALNPRVPIDSGRRDQTEDHQEFALYEFEDGRVGSFQWSSLAYDSPIRGGMGGRFLAEKGSWATIWHAGQSREVIRLKGAPPADAARITRVESDGLLHGMDLHLNDGMLHTVHWDNPVAKVRLRARASGIKWHDDLIGVAGCVKSFIDAVRGEAAPTYGMMQARTDQVLTNALYHSARERRPIEFAPADFEVA